MAKLLKFEIDWADEFNMTGFRVLSDEQWEDFQNILRQIKYPFESYFGTNEAMEFKSSKEILKDIDVTDISESEEGVLRKLFNCEFGWEPIDHIIDNAAHQKIDLGSMHN